MIEECDEMVVCLTKGSDETVVCLDYRHNDVV